MTNKTTWQITHRIAQHAANAPERPALTIDGETWSYGELLAAAQHIAEQLPAADPDAPAPVTAVIADRYASSYLGILACLLRGHTYCPVNADNPAKRNDNLLKRSGAGHIICGDQARTRPEIAAVLGSEYAASLSLVRSADCKAEAPLSTTMENPAADIAADRIAYILFTSGSTGEPKGVPISHGNLTAYLNAARSLIDARVEDRFSQTFGLTFDLSVHDLFVCWISGAHLIAPTWAELARPGDYIRAHEITCWFAVPSMGFLIRSQGGLTPNAFPSIRSSLFCGELFPRSLAVEWAASAPHSTVENWYGPTEATIACSRHVLTPKDHAASMERPSVPIGTPFPQMAFSIHDNALREVAAGTTGELLLHGAQVAMGYLNDPERSAKSFVSLPGRTGHSYRTGDLAVCDPDGTFHILGRIDNQVKVRGHRVELGAIEGVLREAAGGINTVALAWPPDAATKTSIVAALEGRDRDTSGVIAAAKAELPNYMVPSRVVCIETLPINANGKIDRKEVTRLIKAAFDSEPSDRRGASTLTPEQDRLMQAILQISPALSRDRILTAPSLIAAGMDSLSFVSLTAEIERTYGLPLDQEIVVELSELSFRDMVQRLDATTDRATSKAGLLTRIGNSVAGVLSALRGHVAPRPPKLGQRRANRALQFIERFPAYIATEQTPTVMVIGSSGAYRALDPRTFESEACKAGHEVRCLNVGLPAISCAGISEVCRFVRDSCKAANVRLPVTVYELDPMHISTLPPKGDLALTSDHLTGRIKAQASGELDPEYDWDAESGGLWAHDVEAARQRQRPKWEKDRDYEVVRTYLGDIDFQFDALDDWVKGAEYLRDVSDRVVCFIHPSDPSMTKALAKDYQGERFNELLNRLDQLDMVDVIPLDTFDLSHDDFMNVNHVNPWQGMQKVSRQLAQFLFASA